MTIISGFRFMLRYLTIHQCLHIPEGYSQLPIPSYFSTTNSTFINILFWTGRKYLMDFSFRA